MTRPSFPSSRGTHKHLRPHPQPSSTARAIPAARETTVLPFHALIAQQREVLCQALAKLVDAWRALDARDEREWSAFAADAALTLARYLVEHAADVRSVSVGRAGAVGSEAPGASEDPVPALNRHTSADAASAGMDKSAERAADAAVLAFLGLVDALSPAAAMSEIVDAAVALGVIDADVDVDGGPHGELATSVLPERQAS